MLMAVKELDQDRARELVRDCFRDLVAETERGGGFVPTSLWPDLEIEEQREASVERIAALRDQRVARSFDGSVERLAEDYVGQDLASMPANLRLDLLEGVARALIEQQRLFLLRIDDRLALFEPLDELLRQPPCPVQLTSLQSPTHAATKGPTVGRAIEDYLSDRSNVWVKKTLLARRSQLDYLAQHLGPEKPLVLVTPHDIRAFRDGVLSLRANHGRSSRSSFIEKQTDSVSSRIAHKTAELIFEPCKAFFSWATNMVGMLDVNPAANVRFTSIAMPKQQKLRRKFSDEEIVQLFSSPVFTGSHSRRLRYVSGPHRIQDAKFWIPILGYYTGARAGELVQLHVGDIVVDGPVPFISINEDNAHATGSERKHVKSDAGVRQVPIHPDLIALGFLDFVRSRTKGKHAARLFPEFPYGSDGQASTVFSKWFGRCMTKIGLPDKALVFHSFRHGAEDAFRNAKQLQFVTDRIMGHTDGATSAKYGDGVSIEVAYQAVCEMKLMSIVHLLS